jgi:uncharacterized protein (DUF488 family)
MSYGEAAMNKDTHLLAETGVSRSNTPQSHTIYTIGYGMEARKPHAARTQIDTFLKQSTPGILIDVRLTPYSKLPGWNIEDLQRDYTTRYVHLRKLGNLHHHTGQPIQLVDEEGGLEQLERWLEQFDILLLCGCSKVEQCHRRYIAENLAARTHAPICHLNAQAPIQRKPPAQAQQPQPAPRAARKSAKGTEQTASLWTPELWEL